MIFGNRYRVSYSTENGRRRDAFVWAKNSARAREKVEKREEALDHVTNVCRANGLVIAGLIIASLAALMIASAVITK